MQDIDYRFFCTLVCKDLVEGHDSVLDNSACFFCRDSIESQFLFQICECSFYLINFWTVFKSQNVAQYLAHPRTKFVSGLGSTMMD